MDGDHALAGFTVVSTRPAGQGACLVRLLRAQGADVIAFPTIEIVGVVSAAELAGIRSQAGRSDLVVFVSANAVDGLLEGAGDTTFLDAPRIAAIGAATARRLAYHEVAVDLMPEGTAPHAYSTEGLLQHPALAAATVRGQRALIVRGRGGRALLGDTLRRRGAEVRYAELYRRERTRPSPDDRRRVIEGREPMVVVVTSAQGLENFWALMTGARGAGERAVGTGLRSWLETRRYVVVSERLARALSRFGAVHPAIVTEHASDPAICDAIVRYARFDSARDGG